MAQKLIAVHNSEIIAEYDTVQEASEDTLIELFELRKAIRNKKEINGISFYWFTYNRRSQKKVNQLDSDGNIVATYENANVAFEKTGICNIPKVLRGILKSAGGFIWEYTDEPSYRPIKVVLISDTGEFVKLFRSTDELSKYLGISSQEALQISRGIQATEYGYFINISNINSHVVEFTKGHISNVYLRQVYAGRSLGIKPQRIYGACIRGTEINGRVFKKLEDIINKNYEQ